MSLTNPPSQRRNALGCKKPTSKGWWARRDWRRLNLLHVEFIFPSKLSGRLCYHSGHQNPPTLAASKLPGHWVGPFETEMAARKAVGYRKKIIKPDYAAPSHPKHAWYRPVLSDYPASEKRIEQRFENSDGFDRNGNPWNTPRMNRTESLVVRELRLCGFDCLPV